MSKLFIGPFVGEFGHELFCWQGVWRANASEYSHITVVCTPGKEILYKDFADKILTYKPQSYIPNGPTNHGTTEDYPVPDYDCVYVGPNHQVTEYDGGAGGIYIPHLEQKFVKYGKKTDKDRYDYLIHARSTDKLNTNFRNWNIDKWNTLVENLSGKIGCIGTKDGSYYIDGTEDLRDTSLDKLCNILASSKVILGPSSGPMHLASLCSLPQIVWSGDWYNKKRYEIDWNPHNADVKYLSTDDWDIEVKEVLDGIKEFNNE